MNWRLSNNGYLVQNINNLIGEKIKFRRMSISMDTCVTFKFSTI